MAAMRYTISEAIIMAKRIVLVVLLVGVLGFSSWWFTEKPQQDLQNQQILGQSIGYFCGHAQDRRGCAISFIKQARITQLGTDEWQVSVAGNPQTILVTRDDDGDYKASPK
jgi:hypothetical protein